MLLPGGGVEKVLGPHLQRVHRTNHTKAVRAAIDRDVVTISTEARLVQKARDIAGKLPEVRQDLVDRASAKLAERGSIEPREVADAIIDRARERQI